jgi:uncharacterized protein
MSAKNKEIVEKIDAAFAKGDSEAFLSFCADDVEWTMVGEKPFKGKDAIRQWLASMKMEPPKFTVTNMIAEGDFVVSHGHMTMKDKDGKPGSHAYCDIYRFRNAKIATLTSFVIKTEAEHKTTSGA